MARATGRDSQRPVIGVTGNHKNPSPSWLCIKLAVWLAGGRAVRLSINQSVPAEQLDAVIISGGDDIHPSLFDEEPAPSAFYDVQRDQLEQNYINEAIRLDQPMLGICRGHQLINVTFGGRLHLDIRKMRQKTHNRRGLLPTKTLVLEKDTPLAKILGGPTRINSLHYQAVKDIAPSFELAATDLDGLCQATISGDSRIIGVQWHPEYLFYLSRQRNLFRHLVNLAKAES